MSAASLSISYTLFLHCWCGILLCSLQVFLQTAPCSGAAVRTVWARSGGERFSERSTSWTRLSTPPSAASESRRVTPISASSFSCPLKTWVVSTASPLCEEGARSVRGLPVGGLFFERSTAWKLLSRLPSSISEPPLATRTSAHSSSYSWRGQEVSKDTDEEVCSSLST